MHPRMNCKSCHSDATDIMEHQLPLLTSLQPTSQYVRYERNSTPLRYPSGRRHHSGLGCPLQPTQFDWPLAHSSLSSLSSMHSHLEMRYRSLMENTYHRSTYEVPQFEDAMSTLCEANSSSPLRGFGNEIAALTETLNQLKSVEDRQNKQLMVMSKLGSSEKRGKLLATDFDDYNLILKLLKSIDDKRIKLLETMNRLEFVDNEQNKLLSIVDELKLIGDRLKEGILIMTKGGCSTAIP